MHLKKLSWSVRPPCVAAFLSGWCRRTLRRSRVWTQQPRQLEGGQGKGAGRARGGQGKGPGRARVRTGALKVLVRRAPAQLGQAEHGIVVLVLFRPWQAVPDPLR